MSWCCYKQRICHQLKIVLPLFSRSSIALFQLRQGGLGVLWYDIWLLLDSYVSGQCVHGLHAQGKCPGFLYSQASCGLQAHARYAQDIYINSEYSAYIYTMYIYILKIYLHFELYLGFCWTQVDEIKSETTIHVICTTQPIPCLLMHWWLLQPVHQQA